MDNILHAVGRIIQLSASANNPSLLRISENEEEQILPRKEPMSIQGPNVIQPLVVYPEGSKTTLIPTRIVNIVLNNIDGWWVRNTGKHLSLRPCIAVDSTLTLEPGMSPMDLASVTVMNQLQWPWDKHTAYLFLVRGAGGYAGTIDRGTRRICLGDAFIESILGNEQEARKVLPDERFWPYLTHRGQTGALCHELGHLVLDVPTEPDEHPDNSTFSVMSGRWGEWPNVGLTGAEMVAARYSGWLVGG